MSKLETTFAGLKLKNPIIISSSNLTGNAVNNKALEDEGAAAIVLKSLFEEQIEMQADSMHQVTDFTEASDYLQGYIKAHSVSDYLNLIKDTKKLCTIPVIASINCYKGGTWTEFAKQMQDAGADAIELNFFQLNARVEYTEKNILEDYISIFTKIKNVVNIPIIVKMGKFYNNVPCMVRNFSTLGVQGVVLFNRFYQPDIDTEKIEVVSGDILTSPSNISDTLRWTSLVSGRVPHTTIASSTGIYTGNDIVKCILAGASAVEICSTIYKNGKSVVGEMLKDFEAWMDKKQYHAIDEFRGKLSIEDKMGDTSKFERMQFMKYFADQGNEIL